MEGIMFFYFNHGAQKRIKSAISTLKTFPEGPGPSFHPNYMISNKDVKSNIDIKLRMVVYFFNDCDGLEKFFQNRVFHTSDSFDVAYL